MQGRSGGKVSARPARAAQRLADWRRTRPKGARIPEPLWVMAAELARTEGLWRTARTLRLDDYHLKKRVDAATAQACAAKPGKLKPTFVELAPSLVATPDKCMIELEQGDGSRSTDPPGGMPGARPGRLVQQLLECPRMIQITPQMRILVAIQPADFRKGIDGPARICRESLVTLSGMDSIVTTYRGRPITTSDVALIQQLIAANPTLSRRALSQKLCEAWDWRQPNGHLRDGRTTGRGKDAPTRRPNRPIKQVLGYPLHRNFRRLPAESQQVPANGGRG